MKKWMRALLALAWAGTMLCCTACSTGDSGTQTVQTVQEEVTEPREPRERTEVAEAAFHEDAAENFDWGSIDFSAMSQGYVAVKAYSDAGLKFQVTCSEETYTYDLPGDGTPAILPLNMGSGDYSFALFQQVEGTKYTQEWNGTWPVELEDEFQPFLRPSQIVNYTPQSQCVQRAWELTEYCQSDLEMAGAVYDALAQSISYDFDKAATVQGGYLPDPDSTLAQGTGICFDYAALAAAMLRSQGVPCQVITGYVGPEEIYHAWNRIYLKTEGWVSVEIKATKDNWKRVDITFASCGAPADELEDDTRYTTRYTY